MPSCVRRPSLFVAWVWTSNNHPGSLQGTCPLTSPWPPSARARRYGEGGAPAQQDGMQAQDGSGQGIEFVLPASSPICPDSALRVWSISHYTISPLLSRYSSSSCWPIAEPPPRVSGSGPRATWRPSNWRQRCCSSGWASSSPCIRYEAAPAFLAQ